MCAPAAPTRRLHLATFTAIVSTLGALLAATPVEARRGHVGKVELTPYAAYRFGGEIDEYGDDGDVLFQGEVAIGLILAW